MHSLARILQLRFRSNRLRPNRNADDGSDGDCEGQVELWGDIVGVVLSMESPFKVYWDVGWSYEVVWNGNEVLCFELIWCDDANCGS